MKKVLMQISVALMLAASCLSCDENPDFRHSDDAPEAAGYSRYETAETRRVMLLYSAGYNNLRKYLSDDIEEISRGYLPYSYRNDNVALILSHQTKSAGDYKTPVSPVLMRVYKDYSDQTVRDTVKIYPENSNSSSSAFLGAVLSDIKKMFPAASYGLIVSSHGSGWLPAGYYSGTKTTPLSVGHMGYDPDKPFLHTEEDIPDSEDAVKSICMQQDGSSHAYEMDIRKFAEAIPYALDYIIFDACLMGGIEVAYELKDKCRTVAFSQTETLAQGFIYDKVVERLLGGKEPDVEGVCRDYFNFYDKEYSTRAATISMVDCGGLDRLGDVCASIFASHRQEIMKINGNKVQGFFRYNKHYFYDLKDIISHAGVSDEEITALDEALSACIRYKDATPTFLGFIIKPECFCGLSSYLPSAGNEELDSYYRDFKWNVRTAMVK